MLESGPYSTTAGKRRIWGNLSIFAEDGLLFCEWHDTGEREVLDVPTAKERLGVFIEELGVWDRKRDNSSDPVDRAYAIEYFHTLKHWISNLDETIKDAVDQGDQTNSEVRKTKLLQFLRSKRAGTGVAHDLSPLFAPTAAERKIWSRGINLPPRSRPIVVPTSEMPAAWLK